MKSLKKWFGKLIRRNSQIPPESDDNTTTTNNKSLSLPTMAKKTVITKVLDTNAQEGVIEFPQNRTLYVDQFTDEGPTSEENRDGFKPKNMKEVFEHYQPGKQGVALETEDGVSVFEDFEFHQIKDFEDESLIAQSETLSEKKAKIDAYNSIIRQLEKNKSLRNALKDPNSRQSLITVLQSMLKEIEDAE